MIGNMMFCFFIVTVLPAVIGIGMEVDLFEERNRGGKSVSVKETCYRLVWQNFDNLASSFCVYKAIALLYTEIGYGNESDSGSSIWAFSNGYTCFDLEDYFNNKISSIRISSLDGGFVDPPQETLYFYSKEGFMGEEEAIVYHFESYTIPDRATSVIVCCSKPWTLYDQPNYQGAAACIYPKGKGVPGFYPYKSDLGIFSRKVRSGKLGCHVHNGQIINISKDNGLKYLTGSYRGS